MGNLLESSHFHKTKVNWECVFRMQTELIPFRIESVGWALVGTS